MKKLFPTQIDNTYAGYPIAKYVFYLLTAMTLVRSLIHIISNDGGAQSIATIPLSQFSEAAASVIILIFAYWGISQLLIGLLYLLVCVRYQALIPLMYFVSVIEYSLRMVLGHLKPISTISVAPGAIGNYVLPILCLGMFILSMTARRKKE